MKLGGATWLISLSDHEVEALLRLREFDVKHQPYWIRVQVTASRRAGGMVLPLAMGAVLPPFPGLQMPLSGHFSPVRAVVPMGFFMTVFLILRDADVQP
ncbi:MAG: hypothetical protein HC889_20220 [Synechococcaceae cyanobacterium SM1_2_3]|nr:hypothetical protein [Synechococcaceae cyanobacterium SM1_2_3]